MGSARISKTEAEWGLNKISDMSQTVFYIGETNSFGEWRITKVDRSSGDYVFGWATKKNNPTISDFSSAWSSKATLTYNDFDVAL